MAFQASRLRPLGIGDLLDETITLYRRNFLLFAGVAAYLLVPIGLLQFLASLASSSRVAGIWGGLGLNTLVSLLSMLAYVAIELATAYAVSESYLGRPPTIGASYSSGIRRFGATVGLSFLVGLALLLMSITVVGIPVAIYFGICWCISTQVLLLEGLGIRRSIGRSRGLVRGNWWKALAVLILLSIIQIVFELFFGFLAGLPAAILLLGRPEGAMFALISAINVVVSTAGSIIAMPILFSGLVLLYYDLRIRKEGFDLELMAREIGTPGGETPSDDFGPFGGAGTV